MAETNDTQQLPRLRRWVIVACALVSVPASVLLEMAAGFGLPGGRLMFWMRFPPQGQVHGELVNLLIGDSMLAMLCGLALDSALCFAALAGVYWLVYPFFGKWK